MVAVRGQASSGVVCTGAILDVSGSWALALFLPCIVFFVSGPPRPLPLSTALPHAPLPLLVTSVRSPDVVSFIICGSCRLCCPVCLDPVLRAAH